MTIHDEERIALVERFYRALVLGDADGMLSCYAPNAQLWHNFDNLTVDARGGRQALVDFFSSFPVRRMTDIRRHVTDSTIVQQHVLHLERSDGRVFLQPICTVFVFEARKIKRLDEYVDLARMA